ncbi:hypothetical protein ACHAWU_001756 [Discostella pseudostelligera]|uniref:Uncharacterized protein n=1 Tax=Discostella pseudostelligera TaxID=259834 RepID=A0ABD3M870_9STRA
MPGVHPLVRDLYKRAILVGRDYPHPEGIEHVRRKWKEAIRNPENYPGFVASVPVAVEGSSSSNNIRGATISTPDQEIMKENERILRKAVGKGRYVIREMEGTIQLKKYRTMRRRYGEGVDTIGETSRIAKSIGDIMLSSK